MGSTCKWRCGNCIGASLNLYHNILENNLNFSKNDVMKNSKLGPSFTTRN